MHARSKKMKKTIFLLMFVLVMSLSACKVASTDEAMDKSAAPPTPQWEYQWINFRCSYDGGSSELVCVNLQTKDQTYIGTLLNSMSIQGYELDEVVHSNSSGGLVQTFIFRKPYVAPEPVE
jgi:hypothetical protein